MAQACALNSVQKMVVALRVRAEHVIKYYSNLLNNYYGIAEHLATHAVDWRSIDFYICLSEQIISVTA